MFVTKRRNGITLVIIIATMILMLLSVLSFTIKAFAFDVLLHIYLRLLVIPIVISVLKKCFKDQLTNSMNKALILCGCIIVLDSVVVDAFRYILSSGVNTVLFLPICIPLCFMIIMLYSIKDTGGEKRVEKRLTYILGIPLALISLYIEILSFM